jgi:lactoylglutathione lyase
MFVHASIRVSNMERSIKFYRDFLGLQIVEQITIPENNAELVFMQDQHAEGAQIELTYYKNQRKFLQADYEDRLFDHLGFTVKNMQQTLQAMRKAGVTITDEPYRLKEGGSLLAFVEDPDGTLIELIEKAP